MDGLIYVNKGMDEKVDRKRLMVVWVKNDWRENIQRVVGGRINEEMDK